MADEVIVLKDSKTVRGHTFAPIILGSGAGKLVKFSQRELKFLDRFLANMNLTDACKEIGITDDLGRKYLKRKHISEWLEQKFREAALAAGTDMTNHMAFLREVRDGAKEPSATAMNAAAQISRLIRPFEGRGAVSVTFNQNNVNVNSPYSDMSAKELEDAMRERLGTFTQRPTGAA